jgi:hypothetical protein
MAFALKFNMIDVVVSDSLENIYVNGKRTGYQFDIRLNYYRGHFLSVIDEFEVIVDGEKVDENSIRFKLNGKEFGICQLESCYNEFWCITDPATIVVYKPGGLSEGEHTVEVKLIFRSPYMAIGPNHQYMPVDSSGSKTLQVKF